MDSKTPPPQPDPADTSTKEPPRQPPPGGRAPLDPAHAIAVSLVAVLLCGVGLVVLSASLPRSVVMGGCLLLLLGNGLATWFHARMRGTLPLEWLAAAVAGMVVALAFEHALYARAGVLVSGSATAGMLLHAWRRPIEALVAVGSIGSTLTGHGVLYWAVTLPEHALPAPFLRIVLLFAAAGGLMVGTSSALVWCRQALPGERPTKRAGRLLPLSWTETLAWTGLVVSLVCATMLAFFSEHAPPLMAATWAVAATANLGALVVELGRTLIQLDEEPPGTPPDPPAPPQA